MRSIAAALFLWLGVSVPVFAQNAGDLPLVGHLRINTSDGNKPMAMLYRSASAALGWVDGRNVRIEFRLAEGHPERFPELAEALVRDKASVIVASGLPAIRAAQRATSTIPIIATDDDLVAEGVVASLAKPGGNTTGLSILATELDAKRLEILTQILPPPRRIALLRDPANSTPARVQAVADTARALGVELLAVDVRGPDDLAPALASFRASGAEAVNVLASTMLFNFRDEVGRLSLTEKLPVMCQWREMAKAGSLAAYGPTLHELATMQAALIDKLLKGARPGETPVEQPTRFELVINLKTANALGLEIPPMILARADEVIE
jgi:putative tryptophan/tyrosine transport system substrate-binding protein